MVLTSFILESSQSQPVIEDGTGELLMSGGESRSLSSNSPAKGDTWLTEIRFLTAPL